MDTAEHLLKEHKVSVTNIRKEVLQLFMSRDFALSHQDLSHQLNQEIDRVTLYRTLHTFEDSGILHKIIDEEGVSRFALCRNCTTHQHYDQHAHFHCKNCGKIYCLEDPKLASYNLPEGFVMEEASIDLKGYCPVCNDAAGQASIGQFLPD